MPHLLTKIKSHWRDEVGPTPMAYALMLCLIVASCVVAFRAIGSLTTSSVSTVVTEFEYVVGSP